MIPFLIAGLVHVGDIIKTVNGEEARVDKYSLSSGDPILFPKLFPKGSKDRILELELLRSVDLAETEPAQWGAHTRQVGAQFALQACVPKDNGKVGISFQVPLLFRLYSDFAGSSSVESMSSLKLLLNSEASIMQIENPGGHQVVKVIHLTIDGPAWKSGQTTFFCSQGSFLQIRFDVHVNLLILVFAGQINVGDIIKSVNRENVQGRKAREIEKMIGALDVPDCVLELQRYVTLTEPAQMGAQFSVRVCVTRGENDKVGISFQVPSLVCMCSEYFC